MLFLGLFAVSAMAAPVEQKLTQISINEYQLVKKVQAKSVEELRNSGLTDSQIQDIKSIDYAKKLRERAKLSEDTLVAYGYSKDQIKMLKNFKGTEEEINRLASDVNLVIDDNSYLFHYSGNTYFKIMYSWEWNSCPIYSYVDCIGFGWQNDDMYYVPSYTPWHSYNEVKYYNLSDGSYALTLTYGIVNEEQISSFDLNNTITGNSTWSKIGYGQIYLRKTGTAACENQVAVKYGHSTVNTSPTISTGGVGLSFSKGVESMDYDVFYDEIKGISRIPCK